MRVAVDGVVVAGKTKRVDEVNAQKRAEYIAKNGLSGVNEYMKELVLNQFQFQNSPGKFSYPAIDGTETPTKGITVWGMSGPPRRISIWSDGLVTPDKPKGFTIESLRRKMAEVYRVDPQRCGRHKAVYSELDDCTAIEAEIDDWSAPKTELVSSLLRY